MAWRKKISQIVSSRRGGRFLDWLKTNPFKTNFKRQMFLKTNFKRQMFLKTIF